MSRRPLGHARGLHVPCAGASKLGSDVSQEVRFHSKQELGRKNIKRRRLAQQAEQGNTQQWRQLLKAPDESHAGARCMPLTIHQQRSMMLRMCLANRLIRGKSRGKSSFFPLKQTCIDVDISSKKVAPHCSRGRFAGGVFPAEGTLLICIVWVVVATHVS